jgi:CNT family concentrative nucleoside transporter
MAIMHQLSDFLALFDTRPGEVARGLLGLVLFVGVAWAVSEARRAFPWKAVFVGVASQIVLAILLTRVPAVIAFFGAIATGVNFVQSSATAGATFVFGYLGGGPTPFVKAPGDASTFIFALQALPAVLLVSALSAVLWHWGILRVIVRGAAWLFGRWFDVSGPVGVSTSACIFLGMVEAPLLVRPLLPKLSRSEVFILMVDGMSVLAGSMMILLGSLLSAKVPGAFAHLLSASLISTPMAITLARVMIPGERTEHEALKLETPYRSALDAMTHGTINGLRVAAYIAGLLIVFVGTIALINLILAQVPHSGAPLTLGTIFGWVLAPVAWLMGVASPDLQTVGGLLGTKVSMNEVVAYGQLLALPAGALQPRSILMLTYALCSFGNLGSVAILIGTLSAMAPEKADEIVSLGFKALLAAFLTTCMTATLIGLMAAVQS